jgi:hypothetical protein
MPHGPQHDLGSLLSRTVSVRRDRPRSHDGRLVVLGCPWPCNAYPEGQDYSEESLELEVEQGQSTTWQLTVAFSTSGPDPGNAVFDATEAYLSVAATALDPSDYRLDVTADASNLAPGPYVGYVRTTLEECTLCCPVNLTVLPRVAVQSGSWGRIKVMFDK